MTCVATEYHVVTSNLYHEEIGHYKTHGIRVFNVQEGGKKLVDEVLDISLALSDVQALVESLKKCDVSQLHFREILDDYLAG